MALVQVSVEDSGYNLMESVAAVVAAAKSGGGTAALEAAVGQLVSVVANVQALPAEAKADLAGLVKGALVGAVDVVQAAVA
jgi:hypothetical protein